MTGDLYINGRDAYAEYGMSFEGGARMALLTPPALKDCITNSNRLRHGTDYISGYNPRMAERTLDLAFHIVANSENELLNKYNRLCDVLAREELVLRTRQKPFTFYHLLYRSCSQYEEFDGRMAKFVLRVIEPNPNDRSKHDEDI